jgi:hypothetical protein
MTFNNVDVDINREHFTQHGLRMNTSGKEKKEAKEDI